uniref:Uncharacterized protein n=1 Tax=viral metagenome TaxID=1070528 RepID=A0A6C0DU92_9ZZZZ
MIQYSIVVFFLFFIVTSLLLKGYVEGFQPDVLATNQKYPQEQDDVLLKEDYPLTGRMGVSKNNAYNIWWHYPIFKVGSYAQITNNIKYPNNPDDGQCMPAEFCGALYKEKPNMPSNYAEPLPPVPDCPGARVNYYTTQPNLLPFKNPGNILY